VIVADWIDYRLVETRRHHTTVMSKQEHDNALEEDQLTVNGIFMSCSSQ